MPSNAATGYVAKISMLKLKVGSGTLRLSSCMLSIGQWSYRNNATGRAAEPRSTRARGQDYVTS